jgi:hypothetical protein
MLPSGTLALGIAAAIGLLSSLSGVRHASASNAPNSCGCYQDGSGACLCGRKAKCGCPGSCEPKGCDEKREKEINKQIELETKKAEQAGRRYDHSSGDKRVTNPAKAADREPPRDQTPKVVHMSALQRKELARLLDLYTSEHRDHGNKTLNQVRGELAEPSR